MARVFPKQESVLTRSRRRGRTHELRRREVLRSQRSLPRTTSSVRWDTPVSVGGVRRYGREPRRDSEDRALLPAGKPAKARASREVETWIEKRYDNRHHHSAIGQISPSSSNCNTHPRPRIVNSPLNPRAHQPGSRPNGLNARNPNHVRTDAAIAFGFTSTPR